tara:strand:- start:1478 stop:2719 length:1242 start_codon:yes stop_codon:yes gene_type:complete
MSVVNKAEEATADKKNKADAVVVDFLKNYNTSPEHKGVGREQILGKLTEMAGPEISVELMENKFFKFLSNVPETRDFTADELKAQAIRLDIDGAKDLTNPEVDNILSKLDHRGDLSKDSTKDNASNSSGQKQPGKEADMRNAMKDNKDLYRELRKKYGDSITPDEMAKKAVEDGIDINEFKRPAQASPSAPNAGGFPPNMNQPGMGAGAMKPPGLLRTALEKWMDNADVRRERKIEKNKVAKFEKNIVNPSREINDSKADKYINDMLSSRMSLQKNIDSLISDKREDGTKLTRSEKDALQKSTLELLSKYKGTIDEASNLATEDNLSPDRRKRFALEADHMSDVINKLDGLPEGRPRKDSNGNVVPSKDSEFKDKVKEQSKEVMESIKRLIETVKNFFKSFSNSKDSEPSMAP